MGKKNLQVYQMLEMRKLISSAISSINNYQARAQSTRARRACALRALGLLLYSRKGEDFLTGQPDFFTETALTAERWETNRHGEG